MSITVSNIVCPTSLCFGEAGPISRELRGAGPTSPELRGAGPISRELRGTGPISRELRGVDLTSLCFGEARHPCHLHIVPGARLTGCPSYIMNLSFCY